MKKILFIVGLSALVISACKKKEGCTDVTATNYSAEAEEDDGSCQYQKTDTSSTDNNGGNTGSSDTLTSGATTNASIVYGNGATDIDGNKYKSVIIGEQEWLESNLKVTRYNDGSLIPIITSDSMWEKTSYIQSKPAFCWYDFDSLFRRDIPIYETHLYGGLYNWYAVNTNKLCPLGWHAPSGQDWEGLTKYLANQGYSDIEAIVLSSKGNWGTGGSGLMGTDKYGFNSLPAGTISSSGKFLGAYTTAFWWCSTEIDTAIIEGFEGGPDFIADFRYHFRPEDQEYQPLYQNGDGTYFRKSVGLSVRCIKD